ncbi:Uncharacterised protein [Enterobacter cloacae]|nr:Uncharacterised protein [Enterobacter cloacae]
MVAGLPFRRGAGDQLAARAPGEGVGDGLRMTGGKGARNRASAGIVAILRGYAIEPHLFQQQRVWPPAELIRFTVLVFQGNKTPAAVPAATHLFALGITGGG